MSPILINHKLLIKVTKKGYYKKKWVKRLRGSLHYPPQKIMFVLEHKNGEGRITNIIKTWVMPYHSVFVSLSELVLNPFHQVQLLRIQLSNQILKDQQIMSNYQATN